MSNQMMAVIVFFIATHLIISIGVWVSMNDPFRRHEWSYGKSFWWPLVVIKSILIGLYEVIFTGWKR
jgi:hypothetical protein